MRRIAACLALLSTGCMSLEPAYVQPAPAVPASWPVGDSYLAQSEAALPAVTYKDIFRDPRLQALIEQALVNNRDLMAAAANVAAARERYHIRRADQLPQVNASAGATVSGDRDQYSAGVGVPNFEIDLFGRVRSLSHAQLERSFAT
jgi:multidrug efflux system outer membrane protein